MTRVLLKVLVGYDKHELIDLYSFKLSYVSD
jgi:hypothetical protein